MKTAGFKGLAFKRALWAARATTNAEFDRAMKEMGELDVKALEWLSDKPPYQWANDWNYEISCYDGARYTVDLIAHTCSCRKWELSGIPCKHGMSAICAQVLDPVDFVHSCYQVATYTKVYEPCMMPMDGASMWEKTCYIPPLPPDFGKEEGGQKDQGSHQLMKS
ncbi:UNVERIFIED_CONTAM: hypothetical protein Sradi_3306700 [Sesamum radiatum]|uniref:SWIM-type domain-containing protein n=1 Tax=Sesamum radiatum TaxID=300843 RepID=A0AAW2R0R8_SESRA